MMEGWKTLFKQPSGKPTRKMKAVGITGAFATVLVLVAKFAGIELNAEEAAAIVLVGSFVVGYLVKERRV